MWIDLDSEVAEGDVGFLVRFEAERGGSRVCVRANPARTNQSRVPRVYGWCGTTDGLALHADGVVRVGKRHPYGDRLDVTPLRGADAVAALESLGWPELADQVEL